MIETKFRSYALIQRFAHPAFQTDVGLLSPSGGMPHKTEQWRDRE
jgi:hypothetical protein